MARKTVIRHPDGTVTEVTTSTSLGRGCSAFGWFLLALFVLFAPALWWGAWSIFAYAVLALLAGLGVREKLRHRRGPPPAPVGGGGRAG